MQKVILRYPAGRVKNYFSKSLSTNEIHQNRGRKKNSRLLPCSRGLNSCCVFLIKLYCSFTRFFPLCVFIKLFSKKFKKEPLPHQKKQKVVKWNKFFDKSAHSLRTLNCAFLINRIIWRIFDKSNFFPVHS